MTGYQNEIFNVAHVHRFKDRDEVGVSLQWKERTDVIMHVGFEIMNDLAGGISIRDPHGGLERPFWRVQGVGVLYDHEKPTPPGYLRRVAKSLAIDYISDTRDVTVVRRPHDGSAQGDTTGTNVEPSFVRLVRTTDEKKDHIFRKRESTSLCGRADAHGQMQAIKIPIEGEVPDDVEAYILEQTGLDDEDMCQSCRNTYLREIQDELTNIVASPDE